MTTYDLFQELLTEGHGVRVHTQDDNANDCPAAPPVRPITFIELFDDYWSSYLERPEEELAPLAAGPWADIAFDTYGDEVNVGLETPCKAEDFYPRLSWDAVEDGHYQEQAAIRNAEAAFDRAIKVQMFRDLKTQRQARFEKILTWFSTADIRKAKPHVYRFWSKLLRSRKACSKNKQYQYLWLTKKQTDAIVEVLKFRNLWKPKNKR